MNLRKCQEAYNHDPQFHQLIHVLVNSIETLQFTPSEIREAATFASYLHESTNTKPLMYIKEADNAKT